MIKAVIIDDEDRARKLMEEIISNEFGNRIEILGVAEDIETGLSAIKNLKPDVVFLDIRLNNKTGFDLLQQIDYIDFEVVFVTAYDEFAIKAFEFSAFGYILKPLIINDFRKIVDRLEAHLERLKRVVNQRAKILIENYSDEQKIKKLIINHMNGFDVSLVEDIIRLEGDGNYTKFILTGNRRVVTSKKLGEYEELLLDHGFYRIHQSTIVNLRHIVKYEKGSGGRVKMSDSKYFNVSRYRKTDFLNYFLYTE